MGLLAGQVHCLSATTPREIRSTKPEVRNKLEARSPNHRKPRVDCSGTATRGRARLPLRVSQLGFRYSFELRTSDSELAGRLGAAPSGLGFGDPAARAGARPRKVVRLPGIAPGRAVRRTSVAGSHSAVKSQPRKLKGPGARLCIRSLPAGPISAKTGHLLVIYEIPTRGFMADVSVFMGTPPPKPLD